MIDATQTRSSSKSWQASNRIFRPTKSNPRHLSLLSAGLGTAAAASAEAGLQAVDEVTDDGEDEQEDDDNDRDDDVARHFGGWWWEVVWVELLKGSEA